MLFYFLFSVFSGMDRTRVGCCCCAMSFFFSFNIVSEGDVPVIFHYENRVAPINMVQEEKEIF